tara:strand:- start:18861 stop:20195 length:1335 start_codon:yes stop_codon:yes gene_type:complete
MNIIISTSNNLFKFIFLCLVLAIFSGCASNVVFYDAISKDYSASDYNDDTIKVYIDAFGNIYPEDFGLKAFKYDLVDSGSLYDQLSCKKDLCGSIDNIKQPNLKSLCDATLTVDCKDKGNILTPEWKHAQNILWSNKGNSIYKHASKKNRDLFFLIHGFNNTYGEAKASFEAIKSNVIDITGKDSAPLFIEVFWDGFTRNTFGPPPWRKAQASGPLAGFNLRKLFKSIQYNYVTNDHNLPKIMVMTHSSGAFVAGSLFGNPYSALPLLHNDKVKELEWQTFHNNRAGTEEYPIPSGFPSIHLGMIASATPSNTFEGNKSIDKDKEGGILANNTTLIFSINYKDVILKKGFGVQNIDSLGATGVGSDGHFYCKYLKVSTKYKSRAYDFSDGGFLFWNDHDVESYLGRKNGINFLRDVLGLGHKEKALYNCDRNDPTIYRASRRHR